MILSSRNLLAYTQLNNLALNSEERERLIQQVLEFRKNGNFDSAIRKLNIIIEIQPNDEPLLLLKGDICLQGKDFAEAVKTYKLLLPLNYQSTIVRINLSYALFMNRDAAQALGYAKSAWENDPHNTNAIVNYFNALLWNVRTDEAEIYLADQNYNLKEDQVLVMNARLHTTKGDFQKGLEYYDALVGEYPDKHYVQEYAEVLLGKKEISRASGMIETGKELYTSNEFNAIQQKIKNAQMQAAGTETVYFKDITNNVRTETSAWWQQSEGLKYQFGLKLGIASNTSAFNGKTNTKYAGLTINEKWSMTWSGQTEIRLQQVSLNKKRNFTTITGKQLIRYKPTDRRMFGVFISTDILNYTASLTGKNIRSNNVGYMLHIMLDGKNGIYSQGSMGSISDNNRKYEFFGSAYHLFSTQPLLKGGINFSGLHFKHNRAGTYFSPGKYLSFELFADYGTNPFSLSDIKFNTQVAYGLQSTDSNIWNTAFRLMVELSYKFKNIGFALKYQTSNVASSTGTGYQFDWFTFRLNFRW